MAVADFKPTLGKIELSTSGSILTGSNAAFCAKFLDKRVGGAPVSLESLTYVLPGQDREGEGQSERSSVVVNLLMQLRASCDQNNFFLRTGQAAQAQVTARLHQVLSQCSGAARTQAGEIERAIRTRLVQEEEFSRALQKLERELKKNNVSLNQPLPEKETGRWSGSPFRQEKGRTARPEGPENFLRIQMHRSELLWSIGMRQEERAPRRTASHPDGFLKTEERVFSEADRPGEEGRGEQLAYLQKESGTAAPEPFRRREQAPPQGREKKETFRSAGKRQKGRKGKPTETERSVQMVRTPETHREARTVEVSEAERTFPVLFGEETGPESPSLEVRLLSQPVRAERYIYRDSVYQVPGIPGRSADSVWKQASQRTYAPVSWQIFRNASPARIVPAGVDGTAQFVPVFRREQLSGKTGGITVSVREIRTHFNSIAILDRERPVQEYIAEEYTTEQYTTRDGQSPEARLLSRPVRAEQYIYRDNVYQPSEAPGSSVRGSRRQILERNGPEIYRQLLKRSGPEIHWQTLWQAAGGPLRREFLPSVANSSFQQAFPQYVQENFPSEPPQSGLRSLWFKLPRVSQKIWRQTTQRRYGPVNWKIFQSIPAARIVPAGKDGAVQFVPLLRGEQLPGKTGRTIFSVREAWTHSNNISILGRERPDQEHIAEEYKTEQYTTEEYTVRNGPLPETRLSSQPVRAEQNIYRDNVYRPSEVPGGSVDSVWKQAPQWAYAPVDRQMFRSVFPARTVPAGENGAVRFVPVLRREQLPGETGGTKVSVHEVRTHSNNNNISIFDRERPVREYTAKGYAAYTAGEYTTEEYITQDSPSPEAQLLLQPTAATIYRSGVFRASGVSEGAVRPVRGGLTLYRQLVERSVPEVRRQIVKRMPPEVYRQVIERSAPEVYRQVLERSTPEAYRQTVERDAPEVYRQIIERDAPEVYRQAIERSTPEAYRQIVKRNTPEVLKRIVRETSPKLVEREVFRNVPEVYRRTVFQKVPEIFREVLSESGPGVSGTRTNGLLRSVERRTALVRRDTETFVRETWTKNHILYRVLRQKNEAKAEGPKTPLYTERENEREARRRNSVSESQSPAFSPQLTHFAQPLEAAEGTLPELPAYRASKGERTDDTRSVPKRTGRVSRPPEAERAEEKRDGETYVPSVLAPERGEDRPVIVYRSPARPVSPAQPQAASPAVPGQLEGEDVFRAQTVSDGQVRAMEQAFSYRAPGNRREESERSGFESAYAPRAEESINYNRLTEEILVRLERRLRAERRKFGL